MSAALATSFTAPFGGLRGHSPNVGWGAGRRRLPVAIQMRRFHQGQRNTMSADPSSGQSASGMTEWSPLFSAMRAVHARLGAKAAEQLAAITNSDPRSIKRHFAEGDTNRAPNGNTVLAIVRHPVAGIAFIKEATRDLKTPDYREYWSGMAVAVGEAFQRLSSMEAP